MFRLNAVSTIYALLCPLLLFFPSCSLASGTANSEWRATQLNPVHAVLASSVTSDTEKTALQLALEWTLSVKFTVHGNTPELLRLYHMSVLYFSTGGPEWTVRRRWLSHPDVCTWYGIDCTVDEGMPYVPGEEKGFSTRAIAKVRLQYNNLSGGTTLFGHVARYLCSEAEDVWMLDFGNNELQGTIPLHMFVESGLNYLNLRANRLSGPLPEAIGRVTGLREISFSDNMLTGEVPWRTILSMEFVRALWLSNNHFVGTVSAEVGQMQNLNYLYLDMNDLEGTIPPEIGEVSTLKHLALDENLLTGTIPNSVARLSLLEHFTISSNRIVGTIPNEFTGLHELFVLNLSHNDITGTIPRDLGGPEHNPYLQDVHLYDMETVGPIPEHLRELPFVKFQRSLRMLFVTMEAMHQEYSPAVKNREEDAEILKKLNDLLAQPNGFPRIE
mmetsp:Transcript_12526/g.24977  ORF Transcript_12526/g.24977 Transcript_12526/m.24977 type:complete len:443 (+) Transcript_12526:108-1436(+)